MPYGDLRYSVSLDFVDCEWEGAINFRPGRRGTFAYLLSWSGCGGLTLSPDMTLVNPFGSEGQSLQVVFDDGEGNSTLKCVGVIESFHFEGGTHDPIRISAYVSRKSAADLHARFSGTQPKTDLELSWYIISCEGAGEKWYEAAYINGFRNAVANIDSEKRDDDPGGDLKVNVAHRSTGLKGDDGEIDIRLYKFEFQIVPAPGQTNQLHFATGHGQKVVRVWGGAR